MSENKSFLDRSMAKSSEILEDWEKENNGSSVTSFYGSSPRLSRPPLAIKTYSSINRSASKSKAISSIFDLDVDDDLSDHFWKQRNSAEAKRKSRENETSTPQKKFILAPLKPKLSFDQPKFANESVLKFKPRHKIGFPNTGLTCYFNAVLQALLGHSSFFNDLLNIKPEGQGLLETLCHLARFKNAGNQEKVSECIRLFRHEMAKTLPQFTGLKMQDSHEFLVLFCDHLHMTNPSLMADNFHFKLQEALTCLVCQNQSLREKQDFVLRLDLPSEADENFKNLLGQALTGSGIEANCSNCGKLTPHKAKDSFKSLPRVLIIYLQRSQFSKTTNAFYKNRTRIGLESVIDLSEHVTEDFENDVLEQYKKLR